MSSPEAEDKDVEHINVAILNVPEASASFGSSAEAWRSKTVDADVPKDPDKKYRLWYKKEQYAWVIARFYSLAAENHRLQISI